MYEPFNINPKDSITKYVNLDGDVIVYLATTSGIDGRETMKIEFASVRKKERDAFITGKGKNIGYSTATRVVSYEHDVKQALTKLDGLQKVLLGIEPACVPVPLMRALK